MITIEFPTGHKLRLSDLQALVLLSKLIPEVVENKTENFTVSHTDVLRMIEILEEFVTKKGLPSVIDNCTIADVVRIVESLTKQFVQSIEN